MTFVYLFVFVFREVVLRRILGFVFSIQGWPPRRLRRRAKDVAKKRGEKTLRRKAKKGTAFRVLAKTRRRFEEKMVRVSTCFNRCGCVLTALRLHVLVLSVV